jgi:hypothetical protein
MALTTNDVSAISAGISVIPMIIDWIKTIHATANPGAPPLTSDQLVQILLALGAASIAKDEAIKAKLAAAS